MWVWKEKDYNNNDSTNKHKNTSFSNKCLRKIRMHTDGITWCYTYTFEMPLATPSGILMSSRECYITWESQTSNKTPISAINMCVKHACMCFFVFSTRVSPKARECCGAERVNEQVCMSQKQIILFFFLFLSSTVMMPFLIHLFPNLSFFLFQIILM